MGGILALVLCGGGLAVISPWRDHLGSDLPTLWLMVTVGRLLVTPAAAVLLYFSARPPMDFFVIGIAAAFLGVLFFETPMIALDIRRQITDAEHEKPLKKAFRDREAPSTLGCFHSSDGFQTVLNVSPFV